MANEKTTIKIPRQLYEKVKDHVEGTGFSSPTSFIVHVLRDIIAEGSYENQELDSDEVRKVRERLKNLGYLG